MSAPLLSTSTPVTPYILDHACWDARTPAPHEDLLRRELQLEANSFSPDDAALLRDLHIVWSNGYFDLDARVCGYRAVDVRAAGRPGADQHAAQPDTQRHRPAQVT
jgi:hypothetical protein